MISSNLSNLDTLINNLKLDEKEEKKVYETIIR